MSTPVSREKVHHEVEHIDHRPAAFQRRFDADNSRPRGIDYFLQLNTQGPQVRIRRGGGNDQVIRN